MVYSRCSSLLQVRHDGRCQVTLGDTNTTWTPLSHGTLHQFLSWKVKPEHDVGTASRVSPMSVTTEDAGVLIFAGLRVTDVIRSQPHRLTTPSSREIEC